ncbi:cytochrome P450 [Amycolatopsis sp. NPDC059657]|uniref:cytochrome P450 family protein n=1 Tax=Amycolatopsis sp. NPDC059657 TaxID=3346899 RepID=UPI00366CC745
MSTLNLDSHRPAFTRDPYPLLAELREAGPVHRVEYLGVPMWLVTRYADVKAALGNPLVSHDAVNANDDVRKIPLIAHGWSGELSHHMLFADAPEHSRMRRVVNREFTPRRLAALEPRIQQVTDWLIESIASQGKADLIEDFAAPLPATIIMELLGVPGSDRENFRYWADVVTGVREGDMELLPQMHAEANAYLRDLIKYKRTQREAFAGTDLLGALARSSGERLSDVELMAMGWLLLVAGYTTTIDLIGNGMLALLRHPEQLKLLMERPELLDNALEEFLRFDGPTAIPTLRFAKPGLTIGGVDIPAGDLIALSLASADHDPGRFDKPDELDIERADRGHVAFGHGIHFCLGAPLARMEGRIAFRALLARCRDLKLDMSASLSWRVSVNIRGLRHLPVTFTPTRGGA